MDLEILRKIIRSSSNRTCESGYKQRGNENSQGVGGYRGDEVKLGGLLYNIMSFIIERSNKITLSAMIDSLLAKCRNMVLNDLIRKYEEYYHMTLLTDEEYEPLDFHQWVRWVYLDSDRQLYNRPSHVGTLAGVGDQTLVWLQREIDNYEIPTWRDIPTGDSALDSEGEYQSDSELQGVLEEIALETQPWLPKQELFTSETELETEEYCSDTDQDSDVDFRYVDLTEEINL